MTNQILELISNVQVDQRGPWTDKFNYGASDFIHWNPDFISWVEGNFILLPRDPNSPDYQARLKLYLVLRYRLLRLAYAWQYLNQYQDLEIEAQKYREAYLDEFYDDILTYLARYKPDPRQNYDDGLFNVDLEGDVIWGNGDYEDGLYGFRFDVGFWLRRQLDGTASHLSTLLEKTLELYDPQWEEAKALFSDAK
ncbi:MAG: hypothetical protein LBE31_01905 [Deltaproteobacteria bacterium]|nr:hypothetical protein [Deltaproteobacteria bacterium]